MVKKFTSQRKDVFSKWHGGGFRSRWETVDINKMRSAEETVFEAVYHILLMSLMSLRCVWRMPVLSWQWVHYLLPLQQSWCAVSGSRLVWFNLLYESDCLRQRKGNPNMKTIPLITCQNNYINLPSDDRLAKIVILTTRCQTCQLY